MTRMRRTTWLALALLATTSLADARTAQPVANNCQQFMVNIRNSEGSGNYQTNTGNGFYGAYQMGQPALIDAGYMNRDGTWTGRNGVNSLEDYLNNPAAQDDAFLRYGGANLGYLGNWQQYIGQTIGGVTVTRAGLIAGSHLVGAGGMRYWLTSGGDCTNLGTGSDAVDGNGTCAGTYVGENQTNDECKAGEDEGGGGGTCLSAHPVDSPVIFSEYGAWNRPGTAGNNGWHRGVDIYPSGAQGGASKGQPMYAAHDGKTSYGSMGPQLKSGQFWTKYLHSPTKGEPRDLKAGEEIGKIGEVNSAGKPHLHFEVLVPPSAISNTRCLPGENNDDCVFPSGSSKRSRDAYATADAIKSAKPNTWYYVNPERYLKERVPVQGNATARTGRTQSLPNSCTPGSSVADTPTSAGEYDTATAMTEGEGEYYTSPAMAVATAEDDRRSLVIDMGRQSALEVRAFGEDSNKLSARMDSALAHLLLMSSSTHK